MDPCLYPLLFHVGDRVMERSGWEPGHQEWKGVIVLSEGRNVMTDTGHLYDALTGGRVPQFEGPYRAIRSVKKATVKSAV